ncbi:MAG: hypothetical protein JXB25_01370 [Deltaproteobacteria bacterium]|nr:hypothetical protein [Deltaproteobacteria bacterium]
MERTLPAAAPPTNTRRQWRNLVLDRGFQLRHAGAMIAVQLLTALAVAGVSSWFYLVILDERLICDHNQSALWTFSLTVLVLVLAILAWSIRFTHSLAGPLLKLDRVLNAAAQGELPRERVTFRGRDRLRSLEAGLNGCLTALGRERRGREQAAAILQSTLAEWGHQEVDGFELAERLRQLAASLRGGELDSTNCREDGARL